LLKDLEPLKPSYATLTANDSANALVLTDTRANVRRMVEIVNALDTSVSSVSTVRVFPLKYADAKDWQPRQGVVHSATNISSKATMRASSSGASAVAVAVARGWPGRWRRQCRGATCGSPRLGGGGRSQQLTGRQRAGRIHPTIEQLVREIDVSVSDVTELRVFHLANADPVETGALCAVVPR